jgi:hypothetical protein
MDQESGIKPHVWFVKQGKVYVCFEELHTLYGSTLHEVEMFSNNTGLFIKHIIEPISFRRQTLIIYCVLECLLQSPSILK